MGQLKSYWVEWLLVVILMAAIGYFGFLGYGLIGAQTTEEGFSGEVALANAVAQVQFGPRVVGSEQSAQAQEWFAGQLYAAGWYPLSQPFHLPALAEGLPDTVIVTTTTSGMPVVTGHNIIATNTKEVDEELLVGWLLARYDTRLEASADSDSSKQSPLLGANGGASGPATLLELARSLDNEATGYRLCILLLDGEANRGLPGWTELTGVDYLLHGLSDVAGCEKPEFAVVLDLVGGEDQPLHIVGNSTPALSAALWETAEGLGYGEAFIDEPDRLIPGPHNRLIAENIPTVAIIGDDYPYSGVPEDRTSRLSADSFNRVGETLKAWLEAGAPVQEE